MIRVLDVLEHQFPVRFQTLALVAQDLERAAVEHAVDPMEHLRPEVLLERRHAVIERGEDGAVVGGDLQLLEVVILHIEVGRHAALFADAATERNGDDVALKVIGPLMVGADEFGFALAVGVVAKLNAAMSAAVGEHAHSAVFVAGVNHRLVADLGLAEIAGVRNLALEADEAVGGTAEDNFHFALIDFRRGVDPVGHARVTLFGPGEIQRSVVRRCGHVRSILNGQGGALVGALTATLSVR